MAANLAFNVRVNDSALDGLIAKTLAVGDALYSAQAAAQPLDVQLRAIGRRSTEVGRYLLRNITMPMTVAAAAAGHMGYEFDQALSKTAALTGTSAAEMKILQDQVLGLAKTGVGAPKELADALYFIKSSGIEGAKAMDVLTVSAKAAFAGLGSLTDVADAVTTAMNTYADATKDAGYYTDVLTATVRIGKAEPAELAHAIGRILPLANQMGVEFHEVGGAIAAMTQQGLSADTSVTGLRATLTTFLKQLKPTKDGLSALGFEFTDIQKSIGEKGLLPTMLTLRKAVDQFGATSGVVDKQLVKAAKLGGLDAAVEKLEQQVGNTSETLLGKLFPNVKALTSFLILTSNGGKLATKSMRQVADSAGEAGTAFDTAMLNPAKRLQAEMNELRANLTKLGQQIYPVATTILGFVNTVASAFGKLPGPLKQLVAINAVLLAGIGPLFYAFGTFARLESVRAIRRIREQKAIQTSLRQTAAAQGQVGVAAQQAAAMQTAATNKMIANNYALTKSQVTTFANPLSPGGVGLRGPSGRIVSPKDVKPPDLKSLRLWTTHTREVSAATGTATKSLRLFGFSLKGVKVAAAEARIAAVGFMTAIWPLLAFEGVLLLATHWKQVSRYIGDATNGLLQFLHLQGDMPEAAAETVASTKALNGLTKRLSAEMTKLHGQGLAWSAAMKQATTNILGGDFHKDAEDYGNTIANALKVATGRMLLPGAAEAGKKVGAEIARNAARELIRSKAWLDAAKKAFEKTYDRMTDDVLSAFDARTDALIDKVRYTVRVVRKGVQQAFTLVGDQKTPMERELEAFDKLISRQQMARDVRGARESLADAVRERNELLKKAHGAKHTEEEVGNRIFRIDMSADPGTKQEIRNASRAVRNAREGVQDALNAQKRAGMEDQATIERTAADKAHATAEKDLRAQRDLMRRHLDDQLSLIRDNLEKGGKAAATARNNLTALLAEFGVTAGQAGHDIGAAFKTGMDESFAALNKSLDLLMARFKLVKGADLAVKGVVVPKKIGGTLGNVPGFSFVPRRPGLAPGYTDAHDRGVITHRGTPSSSAPISGKIPADYGQAPLFTVDKMYVNDPADAEKVAHRIANKVLSR